MNGEREKAVIAEVDRHRIRERRRTEEELRTLARSWLHDPWHDVLGCRVDGKIIVFDGNGRLDGCLLLGVTEATIFVADEPMDAAARIKAAWATAYHHAPLGSYEQAVTFRDYLAANPGITKKQAAADFGIEAPKASRLTSLFDCQPEVIEAAKSGAIGETDWAEISQLKGEMQLAALDMRTRGASRNELRQHVHKEKAKAAKTQAAPSPIGDLARRLKLPRVGKATVLIAAEGKDAEGKGEEISLDEALEAVRQAERHIKAAMAKGISARTAAAFFKDIAAAG